MRISDWSSDVCSSDLWRVGGRIVDPSRLDCPILNILSETDHIVPSVTACQAGKELRLDSGHVGMIVGRRARTQLWNPLAEWLLESTRQRSEEHTSELQSLMRTSYAVFCLKKKNTK